MKIKVHNTIHDISQTDWDSCALQPKTDFNPFCSHGFLSALEDSHCSVAETGWLPQHISIEDKNGNICGVMPLYLKNHSQGEYVFDHAWANAFEKAGGYYYPKLQCSIPFSPVTSPKLLVHPNANELETKSLLLEAAITHTKECHVSSLHFTFLNNNDVDIMSSEGLLIRKDQQFHWKNENYKTFDDFLQSLSSRKRKNITKERKAAIENDIEIEILTSHNIKEHHWDHYFQFYIDTSNRKWGKPYLNRVFFSYLSERLQNNLILIMAKRNGKYIAGALNLKGEKTLYGRYWGAIEHHPFLHFELCYYQAIEFAIENNLAVVEAGAQGEHKLTRGYKPIITKSAHWIANPSLKAAIEDYLKQECDIVEQNVEYLNKFTPFKKGNT